MGQLIQFIHDIPFREINVLKTKSCFEMVSSISLFGSTFTIFILFRTNTKTTTETEEMQLIQCNGQCTKPIGWVRALVAFKRFFLSMGLFVLYQSAWMGGGKIALIALMWFLTSVLENMWLQSVKPISWKRTTFAWKRLSSCVNEEMLFQSTFLA